MILGVYNNPTLILDQSKKIKILKTLIKSRQTCLSNEYGDLTVQQGKQKKNQDNILIIEILKN